MIQTIKGLYPDFYNRHENLFTKTPIRHRYIFLLPKIQKPLDDSIYPRRPTTDTFWTYGFTLDTLFTICATKIRDTKKNSYPRQFGDVYLIGAVFRKGIQRKMGLSINGHGGSLYKHSNNRRLRIIQN